MKKLDFYFTNSRYIEFLQKEENKVYGDAKTPNMDYPNHCRPKFLCGPLFKSVSGFDYYAPISSYSQKKSANILITALKDTNPVKGSLRVNYMIPVPREALAQYTIANIKNIDHKMLLIKEYSFVQDFTDNIRSFAIALYKDIYNQKCTAKLLMNSCRMKFLENRCLNYCKEVGFRVPDRPYAEYIPANDRVLVMIERNEEMSCNSDI